MADERDKQEVKIDAKKIWRNVARKCGVKGNKHGK